jgi:rare lipoprotein A
MKLILTIALFIGLSVSANAQSVKAPAKAPRKGIASYYHPKFEGRKTATGEVFTNQKFTAASNTLRLNTYVKVTNQSNGRVVYVKINDRMAASNKRLLDLTEAAAKQLGYRKAGLANVTMEVVSEEEGRDGILAQREALLSVSGNNKL